MLALLYIFMPNVSTSFVLILQILLVEINYFSISDTNGNDFCIYRPYICGIIDWQLNRFSLNKDMIFRFYLLHTADILYIQTHVIKEMNRNMANGIYMNRENGYVLKDYGPRPLVFNIERATEQNRTFRTAMWTGDHLQVTLMSINAGEDIGAEVHPELDQFLRIEHGQGLVMMGYSRNNMNMQAMVSDDDAIIVPAGTWHNLINTGSTPLKLYSIYAPPQHPHGTVHRTKAEAMAAEHEH